MSKTGFVYRIIDNTNGNQYHGSTTQTVAQRMSAHRSNFKKGTLTCSSCQILKNGDFRYETLEKVLFEEKFELQNLERKYIENNECVNKNIPSRTDEELKEYYRQYIKQYNIDNPDYQKQYRIDNADKRKQYRAKNPDYNKQYYINNIDKLKKKLTCECGYKYTHYNKSSHIKSTKHQKYLKSIEQI